MTMINYPVFDKKLANGLHVVFVNYPGQMCSIRTIVKAGSILEGDYLGSGISHYAEHLVAGCTTSKRSEEDYKNLTTLLGGAYNAYTTTDHTSYYINTTENHLKTAIDILFEWMFFCSFEDREVEREKDVITREIEKNEASIYRTFFYLAQQNFYSHHPLKFPVIGFLENFKQLSKEDLFSYYKRFYVPENMILVVSGGFDWTETLDYVESVFGSIKRTASPPVNFFNEPTIFGSRTRQAYAKTSVTHLSLRFPTVDVNSTDMPALDILDTILGQGQDSVLYRLLIEDHNIAYSVQVSSSTPIVTNGFFDISVECDNSNADKVKSLVESCINTIRDKGIEEKLIKRAIKQKVSDEIFSITNADDAGMKVGQSFLYSGSKEFFDLYIKKMKDVKAKDINRVLNNYFDFNKLVESRLIPNDLKSKNISIDLNTHNDKTPELIELPNKLKILLHNDNSVPKVQFKAFMKGGVRYENQSNNGIGMLISETIAHQSKHFTKREMKGLIDDLGAEYTFSVGNNTYYHNLDGLSEDFELFVDNLKYPLFTSRDINDAKIRLKKYVEQREDTWASYCNYHFKKIMYQNHPYSLSSYGEIESLTNLTVNDVELFYNQRLNPSEMVVSLYGDIDKTNTLAMLKDTLAEIPTFENSIAVPDSPGFSKPAFYNLEIPQDLGVVYIGFNGCKLTELNYDLKLDLLISILSGIHYPCGRLHNQLRELGYVYQAHGGNRSGLENGHVMMYGLTSKEKTEQVLDVMNSIVENIKSIPVTNDEFERAISQLNYYYQDRIASLEGLQLTNSTDAIYGLDYKRYLTIYDDIKALKKEDVLDVAQHYLTNPQTLVFK